MPLLMRSDIASKFAHGVPRNERDVSRCHYK